MSLDITTIDSDPIFKQLIQPISADSPCGISLDDSQTLTIFDSYRIFGQGSEIEPVPDWRAIKQRSAEVLATSKDLRVLTHFGAALIRTDGMNAFLQTLVVAASWLEDYWDHVHPAIDEDYLLRKNAISCFADRVATTEALRRAPILHSRHLGSISIRDVELANGLISASSEGAVATQEQISTAFAAAGTDDLTALQRSIDTALRAIAQIETKFREVGGTEAVPNLDLLTAPLNRIQRVLRDQLAARGEASVGVAGEEGSSHPNSQGVGSGPIRSRQDAIRALDAVALFFKQTEPSSPVPLFIERAKRLVSKTFLEALAEIIPDSVQQAKVASGVRDSDDQVNRSSDA